MIKLERQTNADRINYIVNHPAVRPWTNELGKGILDMSKDVANQKNYVLMGEHGCIIFYEIMHGLYEAHTQVLPEGRGEWAKDLVDACAEYMFTRTSAFELMTRVPSRHVAAKALTIYTGMKLEFIRKNECMFRGKKGDVEIYSYRIQDWMTFAKGMQEKGKIFHDKLHAEAARLNITEKPHDEDPSHNQYLGTCISMVQAGQLEKALIFYNRWAVAARHECVTITSINPPTVKFDIGLLKFHGNEIEDIEVVPC